MIGARLVIVMVRHGKKIQWTVVADPLQSIIKRLPRIRNRVLLQLH